MDNKQGFCQIQGHERVQLSFICISQMCQSTFRLMCIECVNRNLHNHNIEFYKTFTEFIEFYFKNSTLQQLEFNLQQQKGNQIKCDYLQKVYDEFSQMYQDSNQQDLKQQNESIQEFCSNLVIINEVILNYINKLKNEIVLAQNIYDLYQQLTPDNIDSINEYQLKLLLKNHCLFYQKENRSSSEISDVIKKINYIALNNSNQEFFKNSLSKLRQLIMRLEKLNKYINFHGHDLFYEGQLPCTDQMSEQGRCFAQQFTSYRKKGINKLNIRDIFSKKFIQQYFFNFRLDVRVQFDPKWKYFISIQGKQLFYYVRSHQIKVIRKFKFDDQISMIKFEKLNKIMVSILGKKQQVSIIDFQLNIINIYSGHPNKNYLSFIYGEERKIIVSLLHDILDKTDCIFIYKENEIKPFIVCNSIKKHDNIRRFQMKLFSQDSQLLTSNELIIYSWQIDYVNRNLILIKTIEDKMNLYQLQNLYIIKKYKEPFSQIDIMDQNFNLLFTVEIRTPENQVENIHLNDKFLIYSDSNERYYTVLTRARNDYEQLQL